MNIQKIALIASTSLLLSACSTAAKTPIKHDPSTALAPSQAASMLSDITDDKTFFGLGAPKFESVAVKQAGGQMYQIGDTITILIPADALFEPGTDKLMSSSDSLLADVASMLKQYPEKNILITANTSDIGSTQFKDTLSNNQAQRVAHTLESLEIHSLNNRRELQFAGLGSREPIANQHTVAGMYQNRRIQITLYQDEPDPQMGKMRKENKMEGAQ